MPAPRLRISVPALLVLTVLAFANPGCTNSSGGGGSTTTSQPTVPVKIEFPDGDPAVPAEEGGPGFTGDGWEPVSQAPLEGDPRAKKGGAIRYHVGTFPASLRIIGKDSSTTTNSLIEGLCFETLVSRHSDTLQYYPVLASHWQISDDRMTFRYRINPQAHWPDGKPVVADDVVASWDLMMDETILDPAMQVVFGKFERPRAVSKYIVEVQSKELNWRNFLYFSASMPIFAAHEVGGMTGTEFLERYQFKLPMGTGPYEIRDGDIKKGSYVSLRRRKDYWGWDERFATGLYNFDLIRLVATADYNYTLAFEQFKKGEQDIFLVGKAQDWVEVVPQLETVRRGLIQRRRIYNDEPMGISGIAMNMRKPPLDDVRVRKALAHALNRQLLIEKLFFNEYTHLDSYHAGSHFANPDNEKIRFDLEKAEQLLEAAGWKERDSDGVRKQDGKRLELTLTYTSQLSERHLTVYQEDCQRLGIKLHLSLTNWATSYKAVHGDRNFQLYSQALTGLIDPNPETSWLSDLADKKDNNNITGFKNERVDEIIKAYDTMFELEERIPAIRELDGLVFEQHPYALFWGLDNKRLLFWDKFGYPEWYLPRTGREDAVLSMWWIDEEKQRRLQEARQDSSISLKPGPLEILYWRKSNESAE